MNSATQTVSKAATRKPLRHGLDFVRGPNWKPRMFSRKGAERYGRRYAAAKAPAGFWNARVSDMGDYWRLNVAGQPMA